MQIWASDHPDEPKAAAVFRRRGLKVTGLQGFSHFNNARIALKHNDFEGNHGSKARYAATL
jgi:hypothetical protein